VVAEDSVNLRVDLRAVVAGEVGGEVIDEAAVGRAAEAEGVEQRLADRIFYETVRKSSLEVRQRSAAEGRLGSALLSMEELPESLAEAVGSIARAEVAQAGGVKYALGVRARAGIFSSARDVEEDTDHIPVVPYRRLLITPTDRLVECQLPSRVTTYVGDSALIGQPTDETWAKGGRSR